MDQSNTPPTLPSVPAFDAHQRETDLQHLRILAILHYVFGALSAIGGCAGLFYIVIGIFMASDPAAFGNQQNQPPPPPWMGGMFIVMGSCVSIVAWVIAGLIIYAGRCLATQRNRIFCMVMAALECLSIPLGTVLGVFTLVVLSRPSVTALFERQRQRL